MVTSKKMAPAWLLLLAALAAAVLPLATAASVAQAVTPTVFTTKLTGWSGTTDEKYDVKIEHCADFNNDNKDDIKITVTIDPTSDSGTEDCEGVAFDIKDGVTIPSGLTVTGITLLAKKAGANSFTTPRFLVGQDIVTKQNDLGMDAAGDAAIKTPFDVAVNANAGGAGDGTVQSFSFILFAPGINLNAPALLSNTDWFVRTQSTNGGSGSAKTTGAVGTIPACSSATCGDVDGPSGPQGAFTCTSGYRAKAGVSTLDISTLSTTGTVRRDACCELGDTCGDRNGGTPTPDPYSCPPGYRAKTSVSATSIQDLLELARQNTCCELAATCADADGANGSPNAYSCPPGYKPKSDVSSEVIQGLALTAQRDKCCERSATCADVDGAQSGTAGHTCPANFQNKPSRDTIVIDSLTDAAKDAACCDPVSNNPTCGDIDGNGAGQTAFDCAALGNYRAKPGAGTKDISALTADDKRDTCCELAATCGDADGADGNNDAYNCPDGFRAKSGVASSPIQGLEIDQKTATCCEAANTCGDADGANGSAAPYSCTGVYRRKTGVDSFVIQALTDAEKIDACCELAATCGDANGAEAGDSDYACRPGFRPKANVAATVIQTMNDDAKNAACCEAAATCGDADGANGAQNAFVCPSGYKDKAAASTVVIENLSTLDDSRRDACCVKVETCGDSNGVPFGCPPGYIGKSGVDNLEIENVANKTSACCEEAATCADTNGALPSSLQLQCDLGTTLKANPGSIIIQSLTLQGDKQSACCEAAASCADTNGALSGSPPFNCAPGTTRKASPGSIFIQGLSTQDQQTACCEANAVVPPVTPTPPITPFTIDKSSPGIAVANVPFDFSIAVTFVGAATGVIVTDTMGDGLAFAPGRTPVWTQTAGGSRTGTCVAGASASQLVCQLTGSWSTNDAVTITVPAVASSTGSFTNAAVITDSTSRTASDSETVTVIQPTLPPTPTDVIVTKTVGKASGVMDAGDPPTFVFTVTLTAAPGAAVVNPELVDTMSPTGLEILGDIESVPSGNCQRSSLQGFACNWLGLVLLPGQAYTVSYTTVARKARVYTNTAVSSRADDVNPSNNQATVNVEVTAPEPGPAELAVTKVGPSQATIASPITFTVTAGVAPGSRPASPLVLVEELSNNNAAFDLPLPDAACTRETPQRVKCTWANVGESDTKVLQFTVTGTEAGTFVNTARVSSTAPGVKDKEATVPVTLLPLPLPPAEATKIKLDKAGPGRVVNAGEEFDFTLTASVITGTANSLTLIDTLPAASGLKFVRATPAAPCTVTDLVASCILTGPFPQTIKLTTVGQSKGSFTNTAQLSGAGDSSAASAPVNVFVATCGETAPGGKPFDKCADGFAYNPRAAGKSPVNAAICCEVSAQSAPSLTIRKSVNDAKVSVNDEVLFTIQVKNDGGLDGVTAQNVIVTDTLPVGLKPYTDRWTVTPSVGPTACTFAEANPRLMRCALGAIPAGETRTITIRCLADGSKLGLLSNVASVGCDKPSQQGVADPTCSKTSNPATVTVEKVIIQPQPEACAATLGMTISGSPRRAGKGSLLTWTLTLTPSNGTVLNAYAGNPVPTFLSSPTLTKPPAGGSCKFTAVKGQQILQCNFASISAPVTLQYTTRAAQAGTITSTAGATFKPCRTAANTAIKTTETVVVWEPVLGSCCDGSFGCKAGVAKIPCQRAGGTWSADLTACFSGKFCTGACCSGGGSMAAQCWITTKDACPGSWDASTTCFDQNYCPRPCQSKCQQCTPGKDSCCPGFSCQQSGRFGKSYCLPVCTDKPQCSGAGGMCGLTAGGTKCCDGLDCIVGKGGVGVCAPRSTCKPAGATCGGYGECGSGLFCAPSGKCEPASCRPRGKFPHSASAQAQKNFHEYQCSAHFAATCSGRK
ncbi:hypothetical protein OEZ86_008890 [Tetradesmus obliquus]|nr:hypothetical protein OEZ86_008890 [Tetradesmus obliquus]